jgi:hypothetical protein
VRPLARELLEGSKLMFAVLLPEAADLCLTLMMEQKTVSELRNLPDWQLSQQH